MKTFVTRRLLEKGFDLVALARSDGAAGRITALVAKVAPADPAATLETVRGDVADAAGSRAAMEGADTVFPIAGLRSKHPIRPRRPPAPSRAAWSSGGSERRTLANVGRCRVAHRCSVFADRSESGVEQRFFKIGAGIGQE
jgi:uncharacterized protein YbjT (DUF2867 family)